MSGSEISLNRQRLATMRAIFYLAAARLLVRMTSLERLRESIGKPLDVDVDGADELARFWAGRVERAAMRLPSESKCLPKSVALYWLLKREGVASRIAVAIHVTERAGAHAYHAWLERDGEMLVGHCNREEYRVVLTLGEVCT